jgi:hypothetical protein
MTPVLESKVENRLVRGLTGYGFKVLKLVTPGTAGSPDRMILRPLWSPGAPWVIEIKRPGKHERRLQELVRDDWRKRGVLVLDMVNTYEEVDALINTLYDICVAEML